MNEVPKITDTNPALDDFLNGVNADIAELNILIQQYNKECERLAQIEGLQRICRRKQQIENKYCEKNISRCANYRNEIHHNLFVSLQEQFANLGITSLNNVTNRNPCTITDFSVPEGSLPEILANMDPVKVTKMLEILSAGNNYSIDALLHLFANTDPGFADYQKFLKNNTITYLGGKNCKNFKITPGDASQPFVLKVDYRMSNPKSAEAYLRERSLKNILTPVAVERQVSGVVEGKTITRTLLVTEFCEGGDLLAHSKTHGQDIQPRIDAALDIYSQMSDILTNITRDGGGFTDMKNPNWLIEINGRVRIADSKSLTFIENDGQLDRVKNNQRGFGFIHSKYMNPPEVRLQVFSADKMHSSMLGKNLYQYLTSCTSQQLNLRNDAEIGYDFRAPLFKTPEGIALVALIKNLIKLDPADRISTEEASARLQEIKLLGAATACKKILDELRKNSFKNDKIIANYCRQMSARIDAAETLSDFTAIRKDLDSIYKDPATQAIIGIIKSFRCNEAWYTIGMSAKADRISTAMANMPLEQRPSVMTGQSDMAKNVRMALASHRHFGKRGDVYIDKKTGDIDENRAARSFQFFKATMKPFTTANEDNPEPSVPMF